MKISNKYFGRFCVSTVGRDLFSSTYLKKLGKFVKMS